LYGNARRSDIWKKNRMLDENMMTQAAGGSGFENPDE
jgi:hypothetical protein